jgi:hypothetical protein
MVRTVFAMVIAAHGIVHIVFLIPLLGIADWRQATCSWLFTGETGTRLTLFWSTPMTAPAISALMFNLLARDELGLSSGGLSRHQIGSDGLCAIVNDLVRFTSRTTR